MSGLWNNQEKEKRMINSHSTQRVGNGGAVFNRAALGSTADVITTGFGLPTFEAGRRVAPKFFHPPTQLR
jgi:hypothetical protein